MGLYDEQIKQRIKSDEDSFAYSFANMSSVIMGRSVLSDLDFDVRVLAKDAIDEILRYYRVKLQELPGGLNDMNDQLEYLLRPSGIMRRTVKLEGTWYKDGIGALLGKTKEGEIIAIIPSGLSGYAYYDRKSGKRIKITSEVSKNIASEAICFYKPLPLKAISIKDLLLYIIGTLSISDFGMVAVATLAVTLIGLLAPFTNKIIFGNVINSGKLGLLAPASVLLIGVAISSALINITKTLVMTRMNTKMNIAVQAATMMRVLSLPAAFFKEYSAGELSSRAGSIGSLCSMLANAILTTGLTSIFSLIYIGQIFNFAPVLVVPALIIMLTTVGFSCLSTLVQMKRSKQMMELGAKQNGLVFSLISGVQKLKLSGAERRAFANWANLYSKSAKLSYDPPLFIKLNNVFSMIISSVGMIVLYYLSITSKVGVADYMAFNISYGMVSGAFSSLAGMALTLANIKPVLEMALPIIKTVPEISTGKKVVTKLSGSIELNNVFFRYNDSMPLVLDNISLKIRSGQYVAIVGTTGCGKSTLMRLMLGFEQPLKGAIYYDGKDLSTIDLKSLRRNIGVVMQSGKLFSGDVFSNITISAPWLTMDDAWEAAEMAGIADDIRAMPMGMHTLISEGSGGVSGGQRQRLMIARAIAPKPKILMFDEATRALDNITQKKVSGSLDSLKCTRIVIAHRLSTIKQCDRIIVIDKGKIIEDGKYEDLITAGGYFAELVQRQRLDDTQYVGKTTLF